MWYRVWNGIMVCTDNKLAMLNRIHVRYLGPKPSNNAV